MKARIVGLTQPMIDGLKTAEDLVAYAARVSNPGNQMNSETAPRLLKYLMKNSHWSPFEMVSITVEVETTRDIARQILRHRSFCFQEFSQRYADPTDELGFVVREARLQDSKNRQNSIETDDDLLRHMWAKAQEEVVSKANEAYDWAIANGIAKEQARAVLPEGLTVSRLYVSGTLRSWIHYCGLRGDPLHGTQKEHRDIANLCWESIAKEFPSIAQAVEEIRRSTPVAMLPLAPPPPPKVGIVRRILNGLFRRA